MNTYNENLRSSVVASLQSQELDQKAVAGKLNTSMFTLYHAEGATITANEKLQQAKNELTTEKTPVQQQAVIASNISNNQVSSAKQANQYVKQSITNTAVSAANVQVAANAIVRLASGLGSIYSIVNAADFGTDIYKQTEEARNLINITAQEAEIASQIAMEASMSVSEVSASTVMDKSTTTNSVMANALKVATADYNTVSQAVAEANAVVSAASAKEKVAEGIYEDANADNDSTNFAYTLTNSELNLNLTAAPKTGSENSSIIVDFDFIRNPFAPPLPPVSTAPNTSGVVIPPAPLNIDPVKDYYLIFSKNSKKTTFSITNAESILNTPQQFVSLNLVNGTEANNVGNMVIGYNYDRTKPDSAITGLNVEIPFMEMQDALGNLYTLQDTDGDDIALGTQYVVFVMAVYTDEYKKKLNNYDDFLSAPSALFCLTNILNAATNISISPVAIEVGSVTTGLKVPATPTTFDQNTATLLGDTYWVAFNVTEEIDYKVDYRCMFLPASGNLTNGMLTDGEVTALEAEVLSIQAISDLYDPLIATAQANILDLSPQIPIAQTLVDDLNAKVTPEGATTAEIKAQSSALIVATKNLTALQSNLQAQTTALQTNQTAKQTALDNIAASVVDNLGFIFNLTIAEQILAGNYTPANTPFLVSTPAIPATAKATPASAAPNPTAENFYFASIGPETTDIFGNPLVDQNSYYPVVLSFSGAEEENLTMFQNALSDISTASAFNYTIATN